MDFFLNPNASRTSAYAAERTSLTLSDTTTARALLSACPKYEATPLRRLDMRGIGPGDEIEIFYKDESTRLGLGSFKALGGPSAILRTVIAAAGPDEPFGSVCFADVARRFTFACATDGNHGRAVAAGARLVGARCVIFVHAGVAQSRVDAIAALGADVRIVAGSYDDAVAAADVAAREHGWTVASDTAYPGCGPFPRLVVQGYSVLAEEALEQAGGGNGCPFTHIFVQAGVGGLAAAVAGHFWEQFGLARPAIVVVEPETADCLYQSARAGRPATATGDLQTNMAMLACGEPSTEAWDILATGADAFMTVSDAEARAACVALARDPQFGGRVPTTPSGAAGLAGLLKVVADPAVSGQLGLHQARVLIIGSEGANEPLEACKGKTTEIGA